MRRNNAGVTQPKLFDGVAQLEQELGLRLFVRTTRKVELSEFWPPPSASIADLLNAQLRWWQRRRELAHPERRILRVGCPSRRYRTGQLIVEPFRRTNEMLKSFLGR